MRPLGDPSGWRLLSEGGAHAVFVYRQTAHESDDAGSEAVDLARLVLRVRKLPPPSTTAPPPCPVDATIDEAVWGGDPGACAASLAASVGRAWVVAPVAEGVPLPPPHAAALAAELAVAGRHRLAGGTPPPALAHVGDLLPDATLFPGEGRGGQDGRGSTACGRLPAVCLEVKPKCGWPHGGGCGRGRTRFRLLQDHRAALVAAAGTGPGAAAAAASAGGPGPPSAYDPSALFSGEPAAVRAALGAALAGGGRTPRVRLFVDGKAGGLGSGGGGGGGDAATTAAAAAAWLGGVAGLVDVAAAVLTTAAPAALAGLLAAQAPPPSCPTSAHAAAALDAARAAVKGGRAVPPAAAAALRAHLLAAAARDASLMVALAPEGGEDGGEGDGLDGEAGPAATTTTVPGPAATAVVLTPQADAARGGRLLLVGNGGRRRVVRFRVALVDLDAKPAAKAAVHAAGDAALAAVVRGQRVIWK